MSDSKFVPTRDFPVTGPEVTWAGSNHLASGLCFGYDDGSISFWTAGDNQHSRHFPISRSQEAVNSVACVGTEWFAVSTRADISFIQIESDEKVSRGTFPAGSHGIVSSPSGHYFAPLGNAGLLITKPERGGHQPLHVTGRIEDDLYFYKIAVVHDTSREVLVFANRRQGIGVSEFRGMSESRSVHTIGFEGFDVIDVCGVRPNCLAAVAISPKGELVFVNDVLSQESPQTVRFDRIEGTAYKVVCARGHVFILTSKALYMCYDFVESALLRQRILRKPPLVVPIEAVDINILADKYLILVMADNLVRLIEIDELIDDSDTTKNRFPSSSSLINPQVTEETIEPVWESGNVKFPVKQMAVC